MEIDLPARFPLWVQVWFVVTIGYPFVVLPLIKWRWTDIGRWRDPGPVLVVVSPASVALIVSFLGIHRLARGMSLPGTGHHAAAAGAAEVQSVVRLGSIVSTIVAIALWWGAPAVAARWRTLAVTLVPLSVLFVAQLAFCRFLSRPDVAWSPHFVSAATAGALLASLTAVAPFFLMLVPRPAPGTWTLRQALAACGAVSCGIAGVSWWALTWFQDAAVIWW